MTKVTMYTRSSQGSLKDNVLKLKCLNITKPKIIAIIFTPGLKELLFMNL